MARLEKDWIKLAEYMGYDQEVIRHIDNIHPRCIDDQQQKFLRLWRMPDLGAGKTALILEKIRKSARLCEPFQKIARGIRGLTKNTPILYVFETMKEDTIHQEFLYCKVKFLENSLNRRSLTSYPSLL